jgi:hypothetical protein
MTQDLAWIDWRSRREKSPDTIRNIGASAGGRRTRKLHRSDQNFQITGTP